MSLVPDAVTHKPRAVVLVEGISDKVALEALATRYVVEEILATHGKLVSFRTYQKQPAHRAGSTEKQLRGFRNNWKIRFAGPLVDALDLDRVPVRSTVCLLMFRTACRAPEGRFPFSPVHVTLGSDEARCRRARSGP
jgi:hypothetical protein